MNVAIVGDSLSAHQRPIAYYDQFLGTGITVANYAVGGATSGSVLSGQMAPALAGSPAVLVVFVGTNDFTTGPFSIASSAANLLAIFGQAAGAGVAVVPVAPLPRTSTDPTLATALKALGAWMRAVSGRTVDAWAFFDDGGGGLRADLNYAGDGTHPNEDGELLLAGLIGPAVRRAAPMGGGSVPTGPLIGQVTGGQVVATWTGLSTDAHDWLGLFPVAANDAGYVQWCWVNGTNTSYGSATVAVPSGSKTWPLPASGTYNIRFFRAGVAAAAYTSPSFTV